MHVWDCQTEVRIYNPRIKKLDPRIEIGFFIGYVINFKGYMFYFPLHTPRVIEARNAKFFGISEFSGSEHPPKVRFEGKDRILIHLLR